MAAQQGKLKQPEIKQDAVKISKMKTMQYLKKQQEQALKKVKDMKNKQEALQDKKQDPVEAMIDMMVEQARVQDELHGETAIEHDEFEIALMTFMQSDPDVQQAMKDYMRNMREMIDSQSTDSSLIDTT